MRLERKGRVYEQKQQSVPRVTCYRFVKTLLHLVVEKSKAPKDESDRNIELRADSKVSRYYAIMSSIDCTVAMGSSKHHGQDWLYYYNYASSSRQYTEWAFIIPRIDCDERNFTLVTHWLHWPGQIRAHSVGGSCYSPDRQRPWPIPTEWLGGMSFWPGSTRLLIHLICKALIWPKRTWCSGVHFTLNALSSGLEEVWSQFIPLV